MGIIRSAIGFAGMFLAAMPSIAAQAAANDDPSHLSLVAGYKAAFTCSATFNAGRSVEEIAGDELHRIYASYREAMTTLPDAKINKRKKTVSVAYSETLPPRIAAWRPHLGCTQLPTGGSAEMVKDLPRITLAKERRKRSDEWPVGDQFDGPIWADTDEGVGLAAIVDQAFDRLTFGEGTETTAVIIVKDGAIIAEQYRDGFDLYTPQRTWSVAKSIAATIFGAAVEAQIVAPQQEVGLAAWSGNGDPRSAITFEDLMHMSSGLGQLTAGNRTDAVYFGGGRVVDHAITNRLVAPPGTRWRYANNDTMVMMRGLHEKMDNDEAFLRYPFEAVLRPLGMSHTFLETDWNGDFILSSQVWTTARDMARLGLLYLNDGEFDGQRITPKGWSDYVSKPALDQPAPRSEGQVPPGYGAQFWLYGAQHGLPDGSYAARGNRGQYLMIIPERNILIVRRGFDDGGGFDLINFTAKILAAVE